MLRRLFFNLAYFQRPIWDTGISPPELLDFVGTHTPGRALDVGCGSGTNAITLAQHGWDVTGVDFARRAISIARKKAHNAKVEVDFRFEDFIQSSSIEGNFDLILDMGCFHSLPQDRRQPYISKISRLLSDHGTYLLYLFLKPPSDGLGPGATEEDIAHIIQQLQLVERKDSTERGLCSSAWLTLQNISEACEGI